jgi:glycosyltransferase involved in cell wall biosynthesis
VKFASEELRSSDRALSQWVERSIPAEGKVILHTHFTGFDVAGALVKRRRRETTLLWHIHGVPPSDLRWRVRMRLKFGILGRLVDAFLCPADNIVDAVRSHGAPRPRVHFVPSAIDVERFPIATQEERLEARRELGLPLDGVHLLHFGWHWYLKGGDIFLEALKIVLASEDEVVAIERGGGDEYVEYARKLGIEDKVVVTEAVDDVELLHSAADVLVCSSREEGMAYALLESICSGTPVVATEIPGHAFVGREIRACEITGHAPAEIAAGISRVIARSPEEAAEVAQEGHHWMADNLSIPQVAASMVDRYDELVSASP